MGPSVGDTINLEIISKYLENWDKFPGKQVYAPFTDRMKSSYDYYIFDQSEFDGVSGASSISITITAVNGTAESAAAGCAEPEGGFHNHYYTCTINGAAEGESSSSSDTENENDE